MGRPQLLQNRAPSAVWFPQFVQNAITPNYKTARGPGVSLLLEVQFCGDLQNPLAVGADAVERAKAVSAAAAAKLRRQIADLSSRVEQDRIVDTYVARRSARTPLRVVERVVRFQPKLDARLLFNGDVLEQAHIPLVQARAGETVEAGVHAHAANGCGREARRIDELVDIPV